MRAARQAIDASGTGVLLTGRSEGFIVGRPDLAETVRAAGGLRRRRRRLPLRAGHPHARARSPPWCAAVAPQPVNLLVHADFITVAELAALGVRRISVGGALARAAWAGVLAAAREIADHGTFTGAVGRRRRRRS